MNKLSSLKFFLSIAFILLQIAMIINARFTQSRYFCWAPFDAQNEYRITVDIAGRILTADEIRRRYRILPQGLDSRSIEHIKNIIKQYEQTYGRSDHALANLVYATNGRNQPTWIWPPQ